MRDSVPPVAAKPHSPEEHSRTALATLELRLRHTFQPKPLFAVVYTSLKKYPFGLNLFMLDLSPKKRRIIWGWFEQNLFDCFCVM